MFDHSYCQNVHCQNCCFKEFANFRPKIPATKRLLIGRIPVEHGFSLRGASLNTDNSKVKDKRKDKDKDSMHKKLTCAINLKTGH